MKAYKSWRESSIVFSELRGFDIPLIKIDVGFILETLTVYDFLTLERLDVNVMVVVPSVKALILLFSILIILVLNSEIDISSNSLSLIIKYEISE